MLYRILTEDKNRDRVINYVSKYFKGFTVFTALGYWQGKQEPSLIIEIESDLQYARDMVIDVCEHINHENNQECCLMQMIPVTTFYIKGKTI